MEVSIRRAAVSDLDAINAIYNYYVAHSTCTYQTEPETRAGRENWFAAHSEKYPVFVAELEGEVVGWASLSQFNKRQAYFPTVEDSVYVRHDMKGKGLGSRFLSQLVDAARQNGFHSVMAGISAEQTASVKLHEKFGFVKVAHFREVGFKFGQWLDVVWYQLLLER